MHEVFITERLLLSKEGYASLPMTLCQGGQELEEIHVTTLSSNIQDGATVMVSVGVIVIRCWTDNTDAVESVRCM